MRCFAPLPHFLSNLLFLLLTVNNHSFLFAFLSHLGTTNATKVSQPDPSPRKFATRVLCDWAVNRSSWCWSCFCLLYFNINAAAQAAKLSLGSFWKLNISTNPVTKCPRWCCVNAKSRHSLFLLHWTLSELKNRLKLFRTLWCLVFEDGLGEHGPQHSDVCRFTVSTFFC